MAAKVRGITIELGADASGLEKELSKVNSSIKTTQTQLRDVNKLLKLDPGNAELLAQKQQLLGEASKETASKLDTLREAAQKASQELAAGNISTDQYNALQREIASSEIELQKLTQATDTFSIQSEKIAAVGQKFEEIGNKIQGIGAKLSIASAAVVAFGAKAVEAASNAAEAMNKVEVVFGEAAERVKQFADTALESAGIARGSALDMAASFGDMATSMGFSTEAAADMSIELTQLAGDLASFKNIGVDQAANALRGIFTGEGESLKSLGVIMNETTLSAYAMEKGFSKTYDQMSQSEKVALRYQFVLDSLSNAQGDFARTSDGTANSIRIFKGAVQELGESFGKELLPIITPIIQKITELIKKFSNLPEPVKKIIMILGMLVGAAGPVIMIIGAIVSSIGSIMGAIPGIVGAITALTPVLAAAGAALVPMLPVIIGVTAVLVILGITIYEVVKHWDEIKEAATNAKNSISDFASSAKAKIDDFSTNAKAKIDEFTKSLEEKIKAIPDKFKETFEKAKERVKEAIKNIIDAIKKPFDDLINSAGNWGEKLMDNLTGGIKKNVSKVKESIDELKGNIKDKFDNLELKFKIKPVKNNDKSGDNLKGIVDSLSGTMIPSSSGARGYEINNQKSQNTMLGTMTNLLENMANSNQTVNVILQGDAKGVFKLVRQENQRMIKATGYHALT